MSRYCHLSAAFIQGILSAAVVPGILIRLDSLASHNVWQCMKTVDGINICSLEEGTGVVGVVDAITWWAHAGGIGDDSTANWSGGKVLSTGGMGGWISNTRMSLSSTLGLDLQEVVCKGRPCFGALGHPALLPARPAVVSAKPSTLRMLCSSPAVESSAACRAPCPTGQQVGSGCAGFSCCRCC